MIAAVQYQLNLAVMEAALAAGAHYVAFGSLFHVTRTQLELDARFKAAGRVALLGMGAAPGSPTCWPAPPPTRSSRCRRSTAGWAAWTPPAPCPTQALPTSYS